MDVALGRFLEVVRPLSRAPHRATYEELVVLLDGFLRRRRRSSRTLRPTEVRYFLGYWYLRRQPVLAAADGRRFCAALRVLVRWLGREADRPGARVLEREVARVARETARAALATELLDGARRPAPAAWVDNGHDGYFEVLARGDTHVILRGLDAALPIGPVPLPAPVVRVLRAGCILNLHLVRDSRGWRVVEHGLCYPSVARAALMPAAGAVPA